MIIRVLSLVFLFIVRLRFPSDKSIANVIRSRYNDEIVKQIRRFEKLENTEECRFTTRNCFYFSLMMPLDICFSYIFHIENGSFSVSRFY